MSRAYYNEIDPFAAEWIRQLIKAGHVAPGDVDERDIRDIKSEDLAGYTQCHFFAGIGVWSYALRRAGWPDDRPVWTGSCPCQPFSAAGKGKGKEDQRHLWPAFFGLIRESLPPVVFGEQVAAAIGHGWLDLVQSDMESEDYSFGKAVLGACSVGAPHIRQRLYFVADSSDLRRLEQRSTSTLALQGECAERSGEYTEPGEDGELPWRPERLRGVGGLADPGSERRQQKSRGSSENEDEDGSERGHKFKPHSDNVPSSDGEDCVHGSMADTDQKQRGRRTDCQLHSHRSATQRHEGDGQSQSDFKAGIMGDTNSVHSEQPSRERTRPGDKEVSGALCRTTGSSPTSGFWAESDWLWCRDNRYRPVEPGTFPLAHGSPNRVGRLRGYGNAICAEVAKEFIAAYMGAQAV